MFAWLRNQKAWHRSGVLIVEFENIQQNILYINPMFLFIALGKYLSIFLVEFEHVFAWRKWLLFLQFFTS